MIRAFIITLAAYVGVMLGVFVQSLVIGFPPQNLSENIQTGLLGVILFWVVLRKREDL